MPEQRHQRLQRDTGVDQGGGEGVAQLVRGGGRQPGVVGDPGKHAAQLVDGDPTAVVGEQELGGPCGAGMGQRPARGAVGADAVDQCHGLLVEGHHRFGRELAQRHLQPGPLAGDLVHAVEFEVKQLTHA